MGWNNELLESAEYGDLEEVKECLANGADVNENNYNGETALTIASENGNLEIVKYLVENGANVNTKDDFDTTSLMCASINGHFKVVKYLVENGATVNAEYLGETALYYASKSGHFEVVKYLVANGADVNVKDSDGKTALDMVGNDEIKVFLEKTKELQDNFIEYAKQGDLKKSKNA